MPSQPFSRTSSSEEYTIARQVMDDAVDRYLDSYGPAIAREHLEILANELLRIYGEDSRKAYYEALKRISQAEKAEQQLAHERDQEEQRKLMMSMMGVVLSEVKAAESSAGKVEPTDCPPVLPPKLSTEEAMRMWQLLQQAGYIDGNYQPIGLSRTDMAIVAFELSKQLGIKEKWKIFETLWGIRNLRTDYNVALNQKKSLTFRDTLKRLFTTVSRQV